MDLARDSTSPAALTANLECFSGAFGAFLAPSTVFQVLHRCTLDAVEHHQRLREISILVDTTTFINLLVDIMLRSINYKMKTAIELLHRASPSSHRTKLYNYHNS